MNATCEFFEISAIPAGRRVLTIFAETWLENQEFRIAVFTMIALACIMCWVTSMVREIVRAATTVLCTLHASGSVASGAPCIRSAGTGSLASGMHIPHKTDGGPPPGDPPDGRV